MMGYIDVQRWWEYLKSRSSWTSRIASVRDHVDIGAECSGALAGLIDRNGAQELVYSYWHPFYNLINCLFIL